MNHNNFKKLKILIFSTFIIFVLFCSLVLLFTQSPRHAEKLIDVRYFDGEGLVPDETVLFFEDDEVLVFVTESRNVYDTSSKYLNKYVIVNYKEIQGGKTFIGIAKVD